MLLLALVFGSLVILAIRLWVQAWTVKDSSPNKKRRSNTIMKISYILGVVGCLIVLAGILTPIKEIVVTGMTLTATSIPMAAQAEVLGSSGKTTSILERKIKFYAFVWGVIGIVGLVVSLILM
jgi:uncharacterized membrane protein YphA (DoxX/SURF4 family)